jgi:hypothetical protein
MLRLRQRNLLLSGSPCLLNVRVPYLQWEREPQGLSAVGCVRALHPDRLQQLRLDNLGHVQILRSRQLYRYMCGYRSQHRRLHYGRLLS